METGQLFEELFQVYWKTYLNYLKSKREDQQWCAQNQNWLRKTSSLCEKTVGSKTATTCLRTVFEAVEENPELDEILYSACSKVFDKYALEPQCVA
jgi:hypothetical protein